MRAYLRKPIAFFLIVTSCFIGAASSEAGPTKQKRVIVNGQVRSAAKTTLPNGIPAFVDPEDSPTANPPPRVAVSPPTEALFQNKLQQVRQLVLRNGSSYTITNQVPEDASTLKAMSADERSEFALHRLDILKGLAITLNALKWVSGVSVTAGDAWSAIYNQNVPPQSILNLDGPAAEPPTSATQRGIQTTLSFLDSMLLTHADIVAEEHEYYGALLKGKGAGALVGKYGAYGQGCWGLYFAYNPTKREFRVALISDLASGTVGGVAQITTVYQAFIGIRARTPGDEGPLEFRQYNLPGPFVGTNSSKDFSIGYSQGFGTLPPWIVDKLPFAMSATTKALIEDFPVDTAYSYALKGSRVTLAGFSYSPTFGFDLHSNFFDYIGQLFTNAKTYMVDTTVPFAQRQTIKVCRFFFD